MSEEKTERATYYGGLADFSRTPWNEVLRYMFAYVFMPFYALLSKILKRPIRF